MILSNDNLQKYKKFIKETLNKIFEVYAFQIDIKAEEVNLLKSRKSSLRSSTAIGYILEEFVYQKLKNVISNQNEYIIYREDKSTQNSSYDFIIENKVDNIKLLINIKTSKGGKSNNAVSAINKLHSDYEEKINQKQDFFFLVLKISYLIDQEENGNQTYFDKMNIKYFDMFALEELSFENGHKQDFRNWSKKEFKVESGRLQIDKKFIDENKIDESQKMSNLRTFEYIKNMLSKK